MSTSTHPTLANGQPAISCFALSWEQLKQRNDAAHSRATEELRKVSQGLADHELYDRLTEIAHRTLWHTDFPAGFKFLVCDVELFELVARLPLDLEEANGGKPLDFWDYAYLADLLREMLTRASATKGDRQNLKRALAWVEQQGSIFRDYSRE